MALVLVVAPIVANAPLFDPDEGLHAAIAQEMVSRGDYVTPTFLGEPFLDKPILFFWAEACSLRLLGPSEAAVRLPPLLFGALGMAAVAALGWILFGEGTGLLGGVVYGTMLLPLGVSQVAVHDVAVVPFMCAACAALVAMGRGALSRRDAALAIALAGVALGLSILTKGLVAIAFTGILGLCLAAYNRAAIPRLFVLLTIAGVIAVLVALPWYLAMERAHPGYLHYYFVERHLRGYLTATQRHAGRSWWYYVPIVAGGSLPWTGYLVAAARTARGNAMRLVLWAWFVVGLAFLSAGESKLVTYALPVFPALAILAADAIVSSATFRNRGGYAVLATALAALPAAAMALVAWKFGAVNGRDWTIAALIGAAIATVGLWIRARPAGTLQQEAAATLRLPVMALFGLMVVAPRAAAWMTARDLAAALNAGGSLPSHVSVLDERVGSLVFYLAPPLRAAATPSRVGEATLAEIVSRIRTDPPDSVIAVRANDVPRFNRLFSTAPPPDTRAGTFAIYRVGSLQTSLTGR